MNKNILYMSSLALIVIVISFLVYDAQRFKPEVLRSAVKEIFYIRHDRLKQDFRELDSFNETFNDLQESLSKFTDSEPDLAYSPLLRIVEVTVVESGDLEYPYAVNIKVTSDRRLNKTSIPDYGEYIFKVNEHYELKDPFKPSDVHGGYAEDRPDMAYVMSSAVDSLKWDDNEWKEFNKIMGPDNKKIEK